jgi:hypothetical protein
MSEFNVIDYITVDQKLLELQINHTKKLLQEIEDALTVWQESPYVKGKLDTEERERYIGFLEGVRLSKAHVIKMRLELEGREEQ